jgi:hypothetical protein
MRCCRRLKAAVTDSVSWEAFWAVMRKLQVEEDEMEREDEHRATTGTFSARELLAKKLHNERTFTGPKETLVMPLSMGHATGWELRPGDEVSCMGEIRPKKKCAETKYAERLLRAGELL